MTASTEHNTPLFPLFLRYVSANVLGMIGYSCYILADTFFIARGIGADALAALNLVLPAYSLMNGTGLMIGMGAAARYTISSAQPGRELHRTIFTQALYLTALAAVIFSCAGLFLPEQIAVFLGADAQTAGYAADYIRILLVFSPLFLGNNLLLSFTRNDGAPGLAMTGMIVGSLTNIVLDYVFIYPLGMEMTGAAIATATAPVVSMLIMFSRFVRKQNHFRPVRTRLSLRRWGDICALGVSSLVTEMSSGIVIIVRPRAGGHLHRHRTGDPADREPLYWRERKKPAAEAAALCADQFPAAGICFLYPDLLFRGSDCRAL